MGHYHRYGDVLLETSYSGVNPNVKASYIYAASPVAELLSQKNGATTPEYYLLDGQGSVRGLTNSSTGALTQEFSYDTFGKLTSGDATKSSYLYTGQQYDAASQLYDLRARYYSPQQGRFLSRDTWAVNFSNPMELNRYAYTANNPVNASDPSGYGLVETLVIIKFVYNTVLTLYVLGTALDIMLTVITLASKLSMSERRCGQSENRSWCRNIFTPEQTKDLGQALIDFGRKLRSLGIPNLLANFLLGGVVPKVVGLLLQFAAALSDNFGDQLRKLGERGGHVEMQSGAYIATPEFVIRFYPGPDGKCEGLFC